MLPEFKNKRETTLSGMRLLLTSALNCESIGPDFPGKDLAYPFTRDYSCATAHELHMVPI
jgi:hypothetical protein